VRDRGRKRSASFLIPHANFASYNVESIVGRQQREKHMATEELAETRGSMSRLILFATIASGIIAAYLMYKRGEPIGTIAKNTITNPIGSLVTEVKNKI
jgi:hypothetical protein